MLHGLLSFHKRSCTSGIGPVLEIAVRRPKRPSRGRFLSLRFTKSLIISAIRPANAGSAPKAPVHKLLSLQVHGFKNRTLQTHRGGEAKHEIHHAVSRYAWKYRQTN